MLWLIFLILAGICIRLGIYQFHMPVCLHWECRGLGIGVEELNQLKEQKEQGYGGILDLAGWRVRERELVMAEDTGRSTQTQIMEVYGNMELIFPTKILSGTCGTAGQKDGCVLTKDLAWELFGSVAVTGEKVWIWDEEEKTREKCYLTVAGVIDREGECLMIPTEKGELEAVVVCFSERFQAKEKFEEILEGN